MLTSKRWKIFLSITTIFCVLFLAFPFYMWDGDSSQLSIRNVAYFLAITCSLIVFPFELRIVKKTTLYCVLIHLIIVSAILIQNILYVDFDGQKTSQSYLISYSYSWLGFTIGRFMFDVMNTPNFKVTNISINVSIWLINCYFIFSKVNWEWMQAIYGGEDLNFSGSYQYIGDSFAFISIILLSQLVGQKSQMNKAQSLICFLFIFISTIFCFLNGSRSSFFSLILVFIPIVNILLSSLQKMTKIGLLISLGILILLVSNSFLNFDMTVILENRNFEIISNGGTSSSLEDRNEIKNQGISSILQNPFLGNYTQINRFTQNNGNYIHNVFGTWHYFGFIPFVLYVFLIIECLRTFVRSFKFLNFSEIIFYGGTLFFCVVSVLLFRMPMSFFYMFIVFGIFSTFDSRKYPILNSIKHDVRATNLL